MQTSSIVASVAISCLLNSVWDIFKDAASDCHLPETNSSQLYDLKLQILKNEKVITETLRGNITALEAKVTHTRETTLEECQKVAHNSMQTNKTQMLATLREMQEKQLKYTAEQENRLHLKDVIIANIEKKIDFLESKALEFTNSPNEGINTSESSWFLIPFAQQSQAYLPVTLFILSLGEFVLLLLVCLPRRVKPVSPGPHVTVDTIKNGKPKRPRRDK